MKTIMKINLLSFLVVESLLVHAVVVKDQADNNKHVQPASPVSPGPAPGLTAAEAPVKVPAAPSTTLAAPKPAAVEIVRHMKEPSGGYKKGSPLYGKQEARKMTFFGNFGFYTMLTNASVYAILVIAFAVLYKKKFMQPPLEMEDRVKRESPCSLPLFTRCGFAYSFFDYSNAGSDWPIFLWSFCCPTIQWAATSSKSVTPFMSYWQAVMLMLVLTVLAPFTYGFTIFVMLVVILLKRRQLRKVYNQTHPKTRSWVEDIFLVFCCNSFLCCQLVQEEREVQFTSPKQPASAHGAPGA